MTTAKAPESAAQISLDALLPPEMARKAEDICIKKANLNTMSMFGLAVLAGAFIALGAVFATISWTTTSVAMPWGWGRLVGGLAFSLGLILVVVGGAELFTGNNLIVMAWASRRISSLKLLRNWGIVYLGNLVGSVATALIVFTGMQFKMAGGAVGITALNIGLGKVNLGFIQAVALGIMCNALVCLAVWLAFSGRSVMDKVAGIVFPITAFVAAGFEHCVANMYFIPMAILIKSSAPAEFWQATGANPATYQDITWLSFLYRNLLPVTIGNIIGGVFLVAIIYWLIYLRKR